MGILIEVTRKQEEKAELEQIVTEKGIQKQKQQKRIARTRYNPLHDKKKE